MARSKKFIIKPRGDGVIIIRYPKGAQRTKQGIHLPDSHEIPFDVAKVVDVGQGVAITETEFSPITDLQPGMMVLVQPIKSGMGQIQPSLDLPMECEGRKCELIPQFQILGFITGEDGESTVLPMNPEIVGAIHTP